MTPAAPPPPGGRRAWVEQVMGMPISIHLRAVEPTRPDLEAGVAAAFAHLREVDARPQHLARRLRPVAAAAR